MKKLMVLIVCFVLVELVPILSYGETKNISSKKMEVQQILYKTSPHHLALISIEGGIILTMRQNGDIVLDIDDVVVAILRVGDSQKSIHFSTVYKNSYQHLGDVEIPMLKLVNKWNSNIDYSTSYVFNNNLFLSMVLGLDGGITPERIIKFINLCIQSTEIWIEFIGEFDEF